MSQAANVITNIPWLELIKTLAPVVTAAIAFKALRNWQRQDKAKREAEFLDALIEAAYAYIADLPAPIMVLEVAKVGMASHAATWEDGDETEIAVKGAIAFIEKNGADYSKRLLDALAPVRLSLIRLKSLSTKGQIFDFADYDGCQGAIASLTWHFNRMEAFGAYIGTSSWYWQNPDVIKGLKGIMSIDPWEIRPAIEVSHGKLIEFARAAYKRIYG
jgi:hypothetical protein